MRIIRSRNKICYVDSSEGGTAGGSSHVELGKVADGNGTRESEERSSPAVAGSLVGGVGGAGNDADLEVSELEDPGADGDGGDGHLGEVVLDRSWVR